MPQSTSHSIPFASASYAALRHEGLPPRRAQAELGLAEGRARNLERLFLARTGGGVDPMKPRFALHDAHVCAVLAAGGYPLLRRP